MKITKLLTDRRVRADSLSAGDGCVYDGCVFRVVNSNSDNLTVKTKRGKFLPRLLVDNLTWACLGWLKRENMVTPVNLELIITERD